MPAAGRSGPSGAQTGEQRASSRTPSKAAAPYKPPVSVTPRSTPVRQTRSVAASKSVNRPQYTPTGAPIGRSRSNSEKNNAFGPSTKEYTIKPLNVKPWSAPGATSGKSTPRAGLGAPYQGHRPLFLKTPKNQVRMNYSNETPRSEREKTQPT